MEMKWGTVKERKQTKGKRAGKAIGIQQGVVPGKGTAWGRRVEIGAPKGAVR
jgi:hypothetical protein